MSCQSHFLLRMTPVLRMRLQYQGEVLMSLHDWTRVQAGLFHHFHQDWSIEIARALNRGLLPKGVAALVEQRAGPRESDVLGIETSADWLRQGLGKDNGVAT